MAHSIRSKLKGMMTALVALVATLALVPTMAFALDNTATGTVTIDGLLEGDAVTLYKVVDTTVNPDNTLTHAWNESVQDYMENTIGMTIDKYQATSNDAAGTSQTAQDIRGAVNAAIEAHTALAYPDADGETVGESGKVEISNLPMGEYYVLVQPGAKSESANRTYQHMIVSVQPTQEADGTWGAPVMGTEVEQPKFTEKTDIDKTVVEDGQEVENPEGYKPGDTVEFKITTSIPTYNPNTDWAKTKLTITDTRHNIVKPDHEAYSVTVDGVDAKSSCDIVDTSDDSTTFTFDGNFLKAHQGQEIVITYKATIAGELDHEDTASNTAAVDAGNGTTSDPSTVTFEFYKVEGTKVDGVDSSKLQGAVFSIYRESNGTLGLQDAGEGADELVKSEVASDQNGYFSADGLAEGDYYLVETQAPAGYEALTGSIEFHTSSASDANVISLGNVKNTKDEGVHLPTTGGMGTVAFTAAGVVIIAGAAAFIARSRKNSDNA